MALFAATACASGESGGEGGGDGNYLQAGEDEGAGDPQSGGEVVFGMEAETTNGWCLPSARLAIAGIQVARSIYDTLTVPDGDGNFQPHLAESVTSNEDATEWTIQLRDGITFHDGSPLTADVVKLNLDTYRGANPNITVDLFLFVFNNVQDVTVEGPLTVKVTMKSPWAGFPAHLFSYGRLGIMAQAQLDQPDTCNRNLIGTGPFQLEDWQVNNHLTVVRNESYWRTDADGNQLPYLDRIEYRPITEPTQRLNSLQSGEVDAIHTNSGVESLIIDELRTMAESGEINFTESDDFAEVGLLMLNSTRPPFDNPVAREAAALAINREETNETLSLGIPTLANGPFPEGAIGYTDTGYGEYDPERAAQLVEEYETTTGQQFEVQIASTPSPELRQFVEAVRSDWEAAGITVSTTTYEQSQLIDTAVSRSYQAMTWRNYPALDPDNNYVWWYGTGNPINFMGFQDPEIDDLLDRGRAATDPAEREQIYQELNQELASEKYMLWASWTIWGVARDADVHGVVGAQATTEDGSEYTGFAVGIDPARLWREQ